MRRPPAETIWSAAAPPPLLGGWSQRNRGEIRVKNLASNSLQFRAAQTHPQRRLHEPEPSDDPKGIGKPSKALVATEESRLGESKRRAQTRPNSATAHCKLALNRPLSLRLHVPWRNRLKRIVTINTFPVTLLACRKASPNQRAFNEGHVLQSTP